MLLPQRSPTRLSAAASSGHRADEGSPPTVWGYSLSVTATLTPAGRTASGRAVQARTRVVCAGGAGAVAGVAVAFSPAADAAPLIGWIVAAVVFITWTWASIWPQDATQTASDARREDPSRAVADIACLLAAVASLVAVGVVLVDAGHANGAAKLLEIGLAAVSVVTSWLLIHTVFTLRYARHYYGQHPGGIDFNQADPPCYSDFAYVAFTIGMTFQVSDTDVKTKDGRRLALRHMMLSYLMGAVIIAVTINLVAGMTK